MTPKHRLPNCPACGGKLSVLVRLTLSVGSHGFPCPECKRTLVRRRRLTVIEALVLIAFVLSVSAVLDSALAFVMRFFVGAISALLLFVLVWLQLTHPIDLAEP